MVRSWCIVLDMDTPRAQHGEHDGVLVFDRGEFRRARQRSGLTLAELAQAIGRSESLMKKLQAGHRTTPSADTYRRIIARLGLPYGALWTEAHRDHTTERDVA